MTLEEKEKIIREMIKKFNYDESTMEEILRFMLIICTDIVQSRMIEGGGKLC